MSIKRYWCPKHHIGRTNTVPDGFCSSGYLLYKKGYLLYKKINYKFITPICPVCREDMIYINKMPKKKRKKKK
jgi:hypothetical protein